MSIALAGVFAWLANRGPRSVEELKKDYAAACRGDVWTERWRQKWSQMTGIGQSSQAYWERARKRIEKRERALIQAGYLEERTLAVSNLPAGVVMEISTSAWFREFETAEMATKPVSSNITIVFARRDMVIARLRTQGTNVLVVVAPREDMPKWEKIVRWEDAR